jgi:hypothetical protein
MDSVPPDDRNRNPLWVIVIGMACFCAVVVAVMAQGSDSGEPAEPAPYTTPTSTPADASPEAASPDAKSLLSAAHDADN